MAITASIPSTQSLKVSEKNRSIIPATIVSKCMFYKLNDVSSGTVFPDSAGQFVDMNITAPTDWATNGTYFTPDGTDTHADLTVAQTDGIFDLEDIPSGCVLVLFDVLTAAGNPASNMTYFEYGDGSQGIRVNRVLNSTSVNFEYATAGSNTSFSAVNMDTNQRNSIGVLLDRKANTLAAYKNGTTWDSKLFQDTDFTDSENDGLRLFERTNNGGTSSIPMSNFLAIKFTTKPNATLINQIISDHYTNRGQWSWALEGL